MKPTEQEIASALREVELRLESGRIDVDECDRRFKEFRSRVKEFNLGWDHDMEFFVEKVEDWMEEVPAVWTKPLPFPHPAFSSDALVHWHAFLAEQRRISGQEAAYLTNDVRAENTFLRRIVISRAWLWTAVANDTKIGSEAFWELVLDEVVRELPNWTVPSGEDDIPPDTKTIRNLISVRVHKRFLDRITYIKISRDG